MTNNEISTEDKERLKEIYKEVKATGLQLSSFVVLEALFEETSKMSAKYGKDHALYTSLEQTRKDYLAPCKQLSSRSKNFLSTIADFKLFFLGDLLGWFEGRK